MENLHNGFTLYIPEGSFPLSTDSMALADFIKLPAAAHVLDLGSGCGTLGLLLCAQDTQCRVTGIEIDEASHDATQQNILRNGLSDRLFSICADLRELHSFLSPGSFQCCVSNPPYFSGGPASRAHPGARRNDHCRTTQLFKAAAYALQYGGDFFLVHRPEQLAQLCACAVANGLEPKRLRLLRHRPGSPVSLVLLQCRKGGKSGLVWEEICLHENTGQPTQDYKRIYHLDE